jgi:Novel STAND NTPase 1
MSETTPPAAPYIGLMPYAEKDAPLFFSREAEREIITANLIASRLTLLYRASGVGKSSVLHAGVAYHLRQLAQQHLAEHGTPEFVVVVFSAWRDDPLVGLADGIRDAVANALNVHTLESVPPSRSFTQTLQAWLERVDGDLLIILDQFEEYFLYHPQEDGEGTFAIEFPRAVNRPDLRANFLVSIREDSLAKLDRFKGRIPNLFDNYLRIEHLDREAARMAIENPIERYNRLQVTDEQRVSIEAALVEAVLDQLRTGQVMLGESGGGIVKGEKAETRIETPYLQLVMTRLWNEEMRTGSHVLRLETLNRLGGAERIVKTHLDMTMSALPPNEEDIAARVFHYLVTPSGTKIAHSVRDLAEYAKLPETRLAPVLEKLSGTAIRILCPVAPPAGLPVALRYEIFHDVLAPAIMDWRARYNQLPFQPGLALRYGMVGALVFWGLLLLLHIGLRLGAYGIQETIRNSDQANVNFYVAQIALANTVLAGVAVVIAGRVRRFRWLHSLIAAFVGGCAMSAAILGVRLLFGGAMDLQFIWNTFSIIAIGGTALALLMALEVTILVRWIRRTGLQWARISAMPELKIAKLLLPAIVLTIIFLVTLVIVSIFALAPPVIALGLSARDIHEPVRRILLSLNVAAIGGLMVGLVWQLIERSVQWRQVIIVAAGWVVGAFIVEFMSDWFGLSPDGKMRSIVDLMSGLLVPCAIGTALIFWQSRQVRRSTYAMAR